MTLLQKWLMHYDPIHRGWTPAGIANGLCASNGFCFPRIKGGYNLRRAIGRVPDASDEVVAACGFSDQQIRTFPWVTHSAGTTYRYRLTAISGGGVEKWDEEVYAETAFDAGGNWVGARPNGPGDLRVLPRAGGTFELRWTYTRDGEQAEPAEFRLYHDNGSGTVDYDAVVAHVPYDRGRFHYVYTSAACADGTRVRWAVRAASASGAEEDNGTVVFAWADVSAPPINPTVFIE